MVKELQKKYKHNFLLSLKGIIKDPIIFSAFLVCFLVYSGHFSVKEKEGIRSLCPNENISVIEGQIASNPVKNQKNNSYSFLLKVKKVFSSRESQSHKKRECVGAVSNEIFPVAENKKSEGSNNDTSFSAEGYVKVIIPADFVEALFPGKLYSISKKNLIIEEGANIRVSGKMKEKEKFYFLAENAYQLPWENKVSQKFLQIRSLLRLIFRKKMYYWKKAGGLFMALISGMREYTDEDLKEAFKNAGLSHILALSGMHLSLFSGLSKSIFSKKIPEKLSLIFQFISISLFVFFAGLSPSLFRAFISSTISIFLSFLCIKKPSNLKILSITFLFHVLLFPEDLYSLSFIFSYGAMLGINLFSDFYTLLQAKALPIFLAQGMGGSLGAQTITAPVTLKALGSFAPCGLFSNLIVSPLISLFIYAGLFLFLLSSLFPFLSYHSAILMNILYTIIEKSVFIFSKLPSIQI